MGHLQDRGSSKLESWGYSLTGHTQQKQATRRVFVLAARPCRAHCRAPGTFPSRTNLAFFHSPSPALHLACVLFLLHLPFAQQIPSQTLDAAQASPSLWSHLSSSGQKCGGSKQGLRASFWPLPADGCPPPSSGLTLLESRVPAGYYRNAVSDKCASEERAA